ncbi:GAF domain-containing protein [Azospirillum sp.]|uniref:GAF domain-containing protein n=1 Tax=Azospirillum sp. TaxID=34012 RepID=UPI003D7522FD
MSPDSSPAISLDAIRPCLEGVIPAAIATTDREGVPNVSLLSQVHYMDPTHVALSYQFFNKTRRNILANPHATLQLIDPETVAQYRMRVRYLRTETAGPLFESMKAKLAGIASHTGMAGVFRLLGADVFEVLGIEAVPGATLPAPVRTRSLLAATRRCCERLSACTDLEELLDRTVTDLRALFGIDHAMVLMADAAGGRLYTVASLGYRASGIGSEIALGDGVIGVAARERTAIRITHATSDYAYGRAARDSSLEAGRAGDAREIPFPGLAAPHSQLAVPILAGGDLIGVLFAESPEAMRFCYDDEDALATVTAALGAMIHTVRQSPAVEPAPEGAAAAEPSGAPARLHHHAADDSVFVDHQYLIKGVAGAILWWLVRQHAQHARTEFSNRELRLAPCIRLPEASENLEARLILLQRRLAERCEVLRLEKTGRGRFRLVVQRPLALEEMG